MKVWFKRTGGLAAISMTVTIDTEDTEALPEVERKHVRSLVEAASFFDQPGLFKSVRPEADRFHYQVKVEEGGRIKTIEMDESIVPDVLRPLVDYLIEMARKKRK